MKIYRTSSVPEAVRLATEWTEERIILGVAKEPSVLTGQLATMNRRECEKLNLDIGQGEYLGGSIVNMTGDLCICIITWGSSELAPQIVERSVEWLKERGIAITQDGNDVLSDGKKVISWARATTRDGWCQSVVHFSIGRMDLELVRSICTKPMDKIPGALMAYGISTADVLDVILPLLTDTTTQTIDE